MDGMGQLERPQGLRADGAPEISEPVGRRREDRIVGASEATRQLIAQAQAAARGDLPVLLLGPPGSDKATVARAIHTWALRVDARLESLACSAVPEALQSRELFGCSEGVYPAVPGAYTGALERAAGGSLLLEDVHALRPEVLTALWQSVRERRFRREGDSLPRGLTARVVVTAVPEADVGLLDLPHHEVRIRALSERSEDVLPLAAHFLRAFAEEAGLRPLGFTADARLCLQSEPWPGDVAELRERMRQAVRLAGNGAVTAEALMLARDADDVPSFKEAKRAFETRYVMGLLRRCKGNISRAARLAKKDRKDFYDVIRRTGIDPTQFRG
jgi:two-component system response regulator GlrR